MERIVLASAKECDRLSSYRLNVIRFQPKTIPTFPTTFCYCSFGRPALGTNWLIKPDLLELSSIEKSRNINITCF